MKITGWRYGFVSLPHRFNPILNFQRLINYTACYAFVLCGRPKTKKMKVLLSSKLLASELAKIDFENEQVFQVRGEGSNLIINTDKQTLELWVEMLKFEPRVKQENRRWDWVKKLVSCADEQPIVLDIHENVVNVIFQY